MYSEAEQGRHRRENLLEMEEYCQWEEEWGQRQPVANQDQVEEVHRCLHSNSREYKREHHGFIVRMVHWSYIASSNPNSFHPKIEWTTMV